METVSSLLFDVSNLIIFVASLLGSGINGNGSEKIVQIDQTEDGRFLIRKWN